MDNGFLLDGTEVLVVEKISGGRFVVRTIYESEHQDECGFSEVSMGPQIVVDAVFDKPPVKVVDQKCAALRDEEARIRKSISDAKKDLSSIEREINTATRKRTDISRLIINRSQFLDAKELVVFDKNTFMPLRLDGDKSWCITITANLANKYKNEGPRVWAQIRRDDSDVGPSAFLEGDNVVLFDPTEEQVDLAIREKAVERKEFFVSFPGKLIGVPDKYLTQDLIAARDAHKVAMEEAKFSDAIKKIEYANKILKEIGKPPFIQSSDQGEL